MGYYSYWVITYIPFLSFFIYIYLPTWIKSISFEGFYFSTVCLAVNYYKLSYIGKPLANGLLNSYGKPMRLNWWLVFPAMGILLDHSKTFGWNLLDSFEMYKKVFLNLEMFKGVLLDSFGDLLNLWDLLDMSGFIQLGLLYWPNQHVIFSIS